MTTVVATMGTAFDDLFLPPTGVIAKGAGRVYRFYQTDIGADYTFHDIDGELLIATYVFPTLDEARKWAMEDVRQRIEQRRGR